MQNAQAILFDLDGTISDPKEGIVNSCIFALEKMGHPAPPPEDLLFCIGPPLRENFKRLLKTDDPMLIEQGVFLYRQRYVTEGRGKIENRLYPAIPVVLAKLKEQGKRLYIATAKMKSAADEIIKHFSLWDFFDGVYGPTPEGALADKADLVAHILDREKIAPQSAVMIGDREHDIIAANKNNIQSIGACWGYGSKEELQKAGATMLAERPEDLLKYLCVSHAVPNR